MIAKALTFLTSYLNNQMKALYGLDKDTNAVVASSLINPDGVITDNIENQIVISVINSNGPMAGNQQGTLQRTIPITELNAQLATKFTMVFSAATMLTGAEQETNQTSEGTDIDS